MILMAIDHSSLMFNGGRVSDDSAARFVVGSALPPEQFFTRWVTHLCAPTFVFLAGTAIAISASRRRARGMSAWSIDRDLLIRGAFIALLDLGLMSQLAGFTILQVLYGIGVSMMLMVPLRRVGTKTLFVLAVSFFVFGELLTGLVWDPTNPGAEPFWVNLTLAPLFSEGLVVPYPFMPWLAMMMLGWVFGEWMVSVRDEEHNTQKIMRVLVIGGVTSLVIFLVVRGLDGYGNMFLHREDGSIVQWLHVSKYPPSLAFATLELGLMALCLAGMMKLEPLIGVRDNGPILVYGQTALFFYILHFMMLGASQAIVPRGGLGTTYLGALAVLAILYPICLGFRALKRKHPTSLLRFI
jgi:uncharacterized membrane protein